MVYQHDKELCQLPKPCKQPPSRIKRYAAMLFKNFLRFIVK